MSSSPSQKVSPNSLPGGTKVRSDIKLEPRLSIRSQMSKREAKFSDSMQKSRRMNAAVVATTETPAHTASSHIQEEELSSPLRLALARRSVKKKIFTYMDHGDKKTDIESRTGLSHQCIKWHRRLWRTECSHPRPRSQKIRNSLPRLAQSPSTRSERSSKKRPACDGNRDFSAAGECSSGKRRRKHRAVKQSIGLSVRAGTEMPEPMEGKRAERGTKGSSSFMGKENVPGKDEAMMISVLPIRDLGL